MAESTNATSGWTRGTLITAAAVAAKRSSPSVAITIGAALWAR